MVPVNPKLKALDPGERRLGYEYAKPSSKAGFNPWIILFVVILVTVLVLLIVKSHEEQ